MDASACARLGVEEDLLNQMRVTQTLKVGKSRFVCVSHCLCAHGREMREGCVCVKVCVR